MGRWRGATFKEYISDELAYFSEGTSKNTKRKFGSVNIAGGAYHDITNTAIISDMTPTHHWHKNYSDWRDHGVCSWKHNDGIMRGLTHVTASSLMQQELMRALEKGKKTRIQNKGEQFKKFHRYLCWERQQRRETKMIL